MATITFSIWRLMKENKKPGLRWEYPNKGSRISKKRREWCVFRY